MMTGHAISILGFAGAEDVWLSRIIGKQTIRLDPVVAYPQAETVRGPYFAYLKTPSSDLDTLNGALTAGFRLIETTVTLERKGAPSNTVRGDVRFAAQADEDAVASIAGRAFSLSRFHQDAEIGTAIADRIKAEWVRNFFRAQRGTHLVVAEADGEPAGFLLLILARNVLLIDLIGVARRARGRGLAQAMLGFATRNIESWDTLRVGTQITNLASISLYQKLGMNIVASSYTLHSHVS